MLSLEILFNKKDALKERKTRKKRQSFVKNATIMTFTFMTGFAMKKRCGNKKERNPKRRSRRETLERRTTKLKHAWKCVKTLNQPWKRKDICDFKTLSGVCFAENAVCKHRMSHSKAWGRKLLTCRSQSCSRVYSHGSNKSWSGWCDIRCTEDKIHAKSDPWLAWCIDRRFFDDIQHRSPCCQCLHRFSRHRFQRQSLNRRTVFLEWPLGYTMSGFLLLLVKIEKSRKMSLSFCTMTDSKGSPEETDRISGRLVVFEKRWTRVKESGTSSVLWIWRWEQAIILREWKYY